MATKWSDFSKKIVEPRNLHLFKTEFDKFKVGLYNRIGSSGRPISMCDVEFCVCGTLVGV